MSYREKKLSFIQVFYYADLHKRLNIKSKSDIFLKLIGRQFSIFLLLIFISLNSFAQNKIEEAIDDYYDKNVATTMDTSYVNFQVNNWSLRAFSVFKDHSFQLSNSEYRLTYTPNSRFGVGLGAAYFPLLVDVGINIKSKGEDHSKRFDFQADLVLLDSYFGLVVQDYQGLNISGEDLNESVFRNDIRSSIINFTYGYAFNSRKISLGSIFSGSHQQKKGAGTFVLGGFLSYYHLASDSSIIPQEVQYLFKDLSGISSTNSLGGGIIGGYGRVFVLPHNFFLFTNILAGIGLVRKKIGDVVSDHIVSDPMIYKLNFRISVGYNGSRFYVILTGGDDISISSLDFGTYSLLNVGKAKLIIGFKFKK